MNRKFSLAYLTIPGVDPLSQIQIAGETGYSYVSLRTVPIGLPGEPAICLEKDPGLVRRIKKALGATGLKLSDIELIRIREDLTSDCRAAFYCGAELGARDVLASIWTEDRAFAADQLGRLCGQAGEFGLTVNLEFPTVSGLTTLEDTIALLNQVKAPNLKILMDMLYCHWTGITKEDVRKVDPSRFGIIHLCDCPKKPEASRQMEIIREERQYCGLGVINLAELLKALPDNLCSIELPNAACLARYGAAGHAKKCLDYAKALCERLE